MWQLTFLRLLFPWREFRYSIKLDTYPWRCYVLIIWPFYHKRIHVLGTSGLILISFTDNMLLTYPPIPSPPVTSFLQADKWKQQKWWDHIQTLMSAINLRQLTCPPGCTFTLVWIRSTRLNTVYWSSWHVPLFMLQSALGECSFRCNCSWQLHFKGTSNILQLLLKCAAVRSAPQHQPFC